MKHELNHMRQLTNQFIKINEMDRVIAEKDEALSQKEAEVEAYKIVILKLKRLHDDEMKDKVEEYEQKLSKKDLELSELKVVAEENDKHHQKELANKKREIAKLQIELEDTKKERNELGSVLIQTQHKLHEAEQKTHEALFASSWQPWFF